MQETDAWRTNFTWLSVVNFQMMIDHFQLSRINYLLDCMLYAFFPQSLLQKDGLSTEKQQTHSRYYKKVGQYSAVPHKRKLKFMSVLSHLKNNLRTNQFPGKLMQTTNLCPWSLVWNHIKPKATLQFFIKRVSEINFLNWRCMVLPQSMWRSRKSWSPWTTLMTTTPSISWVPH